MKTKKEIKKMIRDYNKQCKFYEKEIRFCTNEFERKRLNSLLNYYKVEIKILRKELKKIDEK